MKIKKILLAGLAFVFFTGFAATAFFVGKGYSLYRKALQEQDLHHHIQQLQNDPDFVTLEELPPFYLDAVLSIEDHRFYSHIGIDPIAIGRALIQDIKTMSFAQGGSTITQQLAKNLCFTQEKKIERKVAEVFMAFHLEKNYSKDEILELYLNIIYFGDGYYGIGQASQGYYGKPPAQLTESEAAILAGVPNAPSAYAPSKNPELARQRQNQVISVMVDKGLLTSAQAETLAA